MRRKTGFPFMLCERLEDRFVLNGSHAAKQLSVVVSGLSPRQQVLNSHQQPVIAEVNQAFSSFQNDYGQARGTYFASIQNQTPGADATKSAATAFTLYTTQRLELLAQQLISSFLQEPQGASHAKGQTITLKQMISKKIINPQTRNGPTGLLYQSLTTSIPPAGASASTESLYTLSQDNAIQAAQVTVTNAVGVLRNGQFGNRTNP